jgi:hypothetical protein
VKDIFELDDKEKYFDVVVSVADQFHFLNESCEDKHSSLLDSVVGNHQSTLFKNGKVNQSC